MAACSLVLGMSRAKEILLTLDNRIQAIISKVEIHNFAKR